MQVLHVSLTVWYCTNSPVNIMVVEMYFPQCGLQLQNRTCGVYFHFGSSLCVILE